MEQQFIVTVAGELNISARQVAATAELLADGATVPFIARYRKEVTGSLDEVAVTHIRDRLQQLKELYARRDSILASLKERELLTPELESAIMAAQTMTELEDIYLPYRPKRRTRATIAREKGLEPLALLILEQKDTTDPQIAAAEFINPEKGVENTEQALAGACDIIAEMISEDPNSRARIRELYFTAGQFSSKVLEDKKTEAAKYQDYFEWTESLATAPSHRILAMRRGENEGFLIFRIQVPKETAQQLLYAIYIHSSNACTPYIRSAIDDGYDRLLSPSMETEVRLETKKRADMEAIKILLKTCDSSCWHLRWARKTSWQSTLDTAPAARSSFWINRANCWATMSFFRIMANRLQNAKQNAFVCGASNTRLKPSPLVTAPPGEKPRTL